MFVSGRKAFIELTFRMLPSPLAEDLAGDDGAHEVQVTDPLKGRLGQVEEGPLRQLARGVGLVAAGGVEQHVDPAKGVDAGLEGGLDGGLLEHVAADGHRLARGGDDVAGQLLRAFEIEVEAGQALADGVAQNAGPAGHRDDLTLNAEHGIAANAHESPLSPFVAKPQLIYRHTFIRPC
jgi:hypothetical protein